MTIEGKTASGPNRRLRLGMVGGGRGAFIGAVHRIAARLDDRYELRAGALSSDPERARVSGADLFLPPERCYASFAEMARAEAARDDGIDVVSIVTPNHLHHDAAKAFLEAGIHVICDKPLTTTVEDAEDLAAAVERSGLVFALTHNYTGYPMVRQARAMVAAGDLGALRVVQVEYPQDWLSTRLEESGQKQAQWRTDPARSGIAGCVGDIGTHAFQLAEFVTGLRCTRLAADLTAFVEGRRLDDNAHMMLRFGNGARGMLWASQVAPGHENGLRLRVYGDKGGLEWFQEQPNHLRFSPLGEPPRTITRGGPGSDGAAAHATRIPSGHPEGYLEGFAQIYRDAADLIVARMGGAAAGAPAALVPTVRDGVRGVRFIHAAVESSRRDAAWVEL
ncbi:gfo/Idh/MocA family oxidoreductase (plasmid) [Azospirillum baldaniorum]|uniref:Oxidoreductase/dehydrogenase n=1 Tax=Azospirillum baldaniorum TaxID=1064539 RepID=A0A9P1JZG9_9PROT|nr:Gfo/Idh/MocA family oxidoreductase [Azospirillum baldaniorum]AWJ92777.1 gfo/Idh/MocA family oxidoreductase [Azospirillum baldaniorum]TWA78192.1 putative dehydrogenase [Azospirillum brasilense]CCD02686.1 putative oxidoreductase/dehydrogenase [Azospirillum baldaniorum]